MKVLALILCISFAADAWALECTPRPSCEALGFTDEDKSNWCGKEIFCPTDSKYTACVEAYENPCPNGYDNRILSVNDCGEQGSNGWTYASTTIPGNDGQDIRCGKCTPKSCSGYYASYQSASDCGVGGSSGWYYATCYEGDDKLGKCTAKTCSSHGYHDYTDRNNGKWLCAEGFPHSVYLGNTLTDCYSCISCGEADQFKESTTMVYANQSFIERCATKYPQGLWGCYTKYVSGSHSTGIMYYTGKCDACVPIGGPVTSGQTDTYCCKNGSWKEPGANGSC